MYDVDNYFDLKVGSRNQLLALVCKLELVGYNTSPEINIEDWEGMTLRLTLRWKGYTNGTSYIHSWSVSAIFKEESSFKAVGGDKVESEGVDIIRFLQLLDLGLNQTGEIK